MAAYIWTDYCGISKETWYLEMRQVCKTRAILLRGSAEDLDSTGALTHPEERFAFSGAVLAQEKSDNERIMQVLRHLSIDRNSRGLRQRCPQLAMQPSPMPRFAVAKISAAQGPGIF